MTRGSAELCRATDARWPEMLAHLADLGVGHDIYQSAAYHSSPQLGRGGEPFLFAYREGEQAFLWPYLLTPIDKCFSHSTLGAQHYDVTSVYGYAGPVSSPDPEFIRRGWQALLDQWRAQRAVSAFTRFHPILGNAALSEHFVAEESFTPGALSSAEAARASGATISIDLTLDSTEQIRRYQKVLRQEVRKAREAGFTTTVDTEWAHGDDFIRLYRETMIRREGKQEYLIDSEWLTQFRDSLGGRAHLFVTKQHGVVAAALLAMEYPPFLHAHLTGINADLVAHSPLKVLLDDVREWGTERGLKSFHLGGGLGGHQDSLFQFKRRFSPVVHEFHIGCWILDPDRYRALDHAHTAALAEQGITVGDADFFPAYRYQPAPMFMPVGKP